MQGFSLPHRSRLWLIAAAEGWGAYVAVVVGRDRMLPGRGSDGSKKCSSMSNRV
jgi:hypothetical protein